MTKRFWLRGTTAFACGVLGALAAPVGAHAQQLTGVYIGAGVGYNLLQAQRPSVDAVVKYANTPSVNVNDHYEGGLTGVGSLGYGVGNGVRIEAELDYRANQQTRNTAPGNPIGNEEKIGIMGNVFYDVDVGLSWLSPYVGAGFGYQFVKWDHQYLQVTGLTYAGAGASVGVTQTLGGFGYQAIAGLSFPVEYVPGLSLTAEARFLGVAGTRNYNGNATFQYAPAQTTRVHVTEDYNATFMVGLRYAFNTEAPLPPAAPPAPAPQAFAPPPAGRTFIVFFDWDSAALTPRARDIVAQAVRASAQIPHTRIEVSGNTDTSGTAEYNLRLSRERAVAVANEMMRWGVPDSIIDIRALGDSRPLVPTGPGVREPQNRRVEIVYH